MPACALSRARTAPGAACTSRGCRSPRAGWSSSPAVATTYVTDTPGPHPDSPTVLLLHAVGCTGLLTWFPAIGRCASGTASSPSTSAGTAAASSRRSSRSYDCADDAAALLDVLEHRPRRSWPASRWARSWRSGCGASTPSGSAGWCCAPRPTGSGVGVGERVFSPGHGARDARRPRRLPLAYGGARARTAPPTPSTSRPADIHDWALARVPQHQPVGGRPGAGRAGPAPLPAVAVADRRPDRGRGHHARTG